MLLGASGGPPLSTGDCSNESAVSRGGMFKYSPDEVEGGVLVGGYLICLDLSNRLSATTPTSSRLRCRQLNELCVLSVRVGSDLAVTCACWSAQTPFPYSGCQCCHWQETAQLSF